MGQLPEEGAMVKTWKPQSRQREMLDLAWEHVESVPYRVSLRWLFYRLLDDQFYSHKKEYKGHFMRNLRRARREWYKDWRPWTLEDDTRAPVYRGWGYQDVEDWWERHIMRLGATFDRWRDQAQYVELWFEARAMRSQFEHYTQNIVLRPFGGDPSIQFKWNIIPDLEKVAERYPDKPRIMLYFGDADDKGYQIPRDAAKIIRQWGCVDFEIVRIGLNPGDGERLGMTENPDKPGCYQWEGLTDEQARPIITEALRQYVDFEAMEAIAEEEQRVTRHFRKEMRALIETW